MSWTMPWEGERQSRLWLAWPSTGYTLGDTAAEAELTRRTWAAVANAASEFEPVTVVACPEDVETARRYLGEAVEIRARAIDDAWIRDSGPTFVRDGDELGAVTWVFDGWGKQSWATWELDATLAPAVAEWSAATRVDSHLVNEGGGIHVDGLGTVLLTETVQLGRNPGWSRSMVEAELARTIGATRAIWLPRGLTRDAERFGTNGHVDIVATFAAPGVVLLHDQRDPAHPDHAVTAEIREVLTDAVDARGERLRIVDLPAPATLQDAEGWVDWSYVNHVLVNDAVIACGFGDRHDADAAAILADAYPGREVVTLDARPIFARGGGIHCITQQQPAVVPVELGEARRDGSGVVRTPRNAALLDGADRIHDMLEAARDQPISRGLSLERAEELIAEIRRDRDER